MPNDQKAAPAGRPKNVNERQLDDAMKTLLARIEALEGGTPTLAADGNVPLSRGHFFLHLMAGMCIHRGEAAFNPQFLDTVRNNADDFYEAYTQIVRGTQVVQSTTRQLLDDTQARLRVIEREKQDLSRRIHEMENEAQILTAGTEEADEEG